MAWKSIVGHDEQAAALTRAAGRGRLAHAYLFVGPDGIGKRRFARQLAKTLLCENASSHPWDSCDECAACKLVDAGTHPDLFETARPEDKQEFPIAVIQDLCKQLSLKPSRGGWKIAIVDDADDFNEESANAFLKTLEEPPPASLLILVSTNAERQLPTIRSRCQVISFSPLQPAEVESVLRSSGAFEAGSIAALSVRCEGRPGFAGELAQPRFWELRTRLLTAATSDARDATALAAEVWSFVQEAGKDAAAQRRRAAIIVRLLIEALRRALAAPDTADPTSLRSVPADRLVEWLESCLAADMQIERRVQLVLVLEALVNSWTRASRPIQR